MKLLVYVKNFGKIKEAKIDINSFTVFVGNNNSGKTYMMQLVYGILEHLKMIEQFESDFLADLDGKIVLDDKMYQQLNKDINLYLEIHKDDIVEEIFNKRINLDELKLEIIPEKQDKIKIKFEDRGTANLSSSGDKQDIKKVKWVKITYEEQKTIVYRQDFGFFYQDSEKEERKQFLYGVLVCVIFKFSKFESSSALYLPASRTGILMLYKYFFSERDKNSQYLLKKDSNKGVILYGAKENSNDMGLITPVYDFLQFLLRYSEERKGKKNESLIQFIQENLIEGKVESNMGNFVYKQDRSDEVVPLYLASSMVNELTPVLMALSNQTQYRYILYDEIETCLHPFKQREMARLLNRMNNKGFKMIVSTHSDTMAAKLNNLFLLSFMDDKNAQKKKIEKLGLSEDDLLENKNVKVYQFVNDEEGRSTVNELKFRNTPYLGYDFSMFTKNSMELYHEAEIILEDN